MLSPLSSFDKRKSRVRGRVKERNKSSRLRISVFRSNKNFYAQLIDLEGKVLLSYSSLGISDDKLKGIKGVDVAIVVGEEFSKLCAKNKVEEVVFDKGAYLYSGRVKAFADSCRKSGLKF